MRSISRPGAAIVCVLSGIIIFCGMRIITILSEYRYSAALHEDLRNLVVSAPELSANIPIFSPSPSVSPNTEPSPGAETSVPETPQPPSPEPVLNINFEVLHEINSDAVGWIWIPDSDVNYPLMQGEDNNTYLYTAYDKSESSAGSIFLDSENSADFTDRHSIIYGHNMLDGSMFGRLYKYRDSQYAREHKYIYVFLPNATLKYEVFAHVITNINRQNSYRIDFRNNKDYVDYLKELKGASTFELDATPVAQDKILTLSTCVVNEDSNRRVIHAVLVELIDSTVLIEEFAEDEPAVVIVPEDEEVPAEPEPEEEPPTTEESDYEDQEVIETYEYEFEDEYFEEYYDDYYEELYYEEEPYYEDEVPVNSEPSYNEDEYSDETVSNGDEPVSDEPVVDPADEPKPPVEPEPSDESEPSVEPEPSDESEPSVEPEPSDESEPPVEPEHSDEGVSPDEETEPEPSSSEEQKSDYE